MYLDVPNSTQRGACYNVQTQKYTLFTKDNYVDCMLCPDGNKPSQTDNGGLFCSNDSGIITVLDDSNRNDIIVPGTYCGSSFGDGGGGEDGGDDNNDEEERLFCFFEYSKEVVDWDNEII